MKPIINFTNKDFAKIKESLINNAKTYYPDTNKNFSTTSFGSLVFDAVAYVGDILSFYTDYQYNEQFLDTANEYKNIVKLAKQNGFLDKGRPSAQGKIAIYLKIPANSLGKPDTSYIPILKAGSKIQSSNGVNYLLSEDLDFNSPTTRYVVATTNNSGIPTEYAIKNYGNCISGDLYIQTETITSYSDFLKIKIKNPYLSEIITVLDSAGNEYFEVDYLTQNIIFKSIKNTNTLSNFYAPYIIQKHYAPRRFIIENIDGFYNLVFGNGIYDAMKDPSSVAIDRYGRTYESNANFDPSNITKSDKFGIGPQNTTITIAYRANTNENSNSSIGSLNKIINPLLEFQYDGLSISTINSIKASILIENEEPIVGSSLFLTQDELKIKAYGSFSSQNRCVTANDYVTYCYNMSPKFGQIKRASISRNPLSAKNSLSLFVTSEDQNNNLIQTNTTVKENLKKWLESKKMINDIINIQDAKIANIAIEFTVQSYANANKFLVLAECYSALRQKFLTKLNIGEPLLIDEIYKTLNLLPSVVDTKKIKIKNKTSTGYSSYVFDIDSNLSSDNKKLEVDISTILEIKYLEKDIIGHVI